MKKGLIFVLSFVLIFVSVSFVSAVCIDSDNGVNFDVKGTATSGGSSLEDTCITTTVLNERSCSNLGDIILYFSLYMKNIFSIRKQKQNFTVLLFASQEKTWNNFEFIFSGKLSLACPSSNHQNL